MSDHYIEEASLSIAWAKAVRIASAPGKKEISPLVVSMTGFDGQGNPTETPAIRDALDLVLEQRQKQTVETVASTLFPYRMWNRTRPRIELFDRYKKILPKLRKASTKNRYGLYFERMINGGPNDPHPNQLDFVIGQYCSDSSVRRSMLQIGIFVPALDVTSAAQRGFPCLQHVTFAPVGDKLTVNAFYATQYLVERAYGNYLGLCRLGAFAAHEMGLQLSRVTCYSGIAQIDGSKGDLGPVFSALGNVVSTLAAPGE